MYDPVSVRVTTADESGASNAIVSTHGRIKVHKVVIDGATSNAQCIVAINDHTAIGSSAVVIGLRTAEVATGSVFTTYAETVFNPPVPLEVGLSIDMTNTGTCRVYYTAG